MPAVPSNKLQHRLQQQHMEGQRADPYAKRIAKGLILAVYDRATREQGVPGEIAAKLANSPGLVMIKCLLLSGRIIYVELSISADERHATYGNNENMFGRPVEIEYRSKNIQNGRARVCSDNLNLGVTESQMNQALNISGAI